MNHQANGFSFSWLIFYLPEGRHPIIPFFQHSIIPIAERSGAKFINIDKIVLKL
jgi:hypothetical protein